ncbi:MAG: PleD family two-component system response regulator [Candidatus Thorarchaeota archaeon]
MKKISQINKKVKKDIKWYSYVDPYLDTKLKTFMDEFKIKNQAKLIRNFVDYSIDYINAVFQKKPLNGPTDYDEEYFDEYIRKAIDTYELENGFYDELKQRISPLKLAILMLEKHLEDPRALLETIVNVQKALKDLEDTVKQHFEKPKLVRFVKKVDILYIEDSELERRTIDTYFKTQGKNIQTVETADEGLYLLKMLTPKVILVDINLKTSNINGDEFCRILKSHGEYRSIPVILISAVVAKTRKQEILNKTGADEIIFKPIGDLSDLHIIFKYLKQY